MRIAFCWATISGYFAACLRELALLDGVEVLGIFPEVAEKSLVEFRQDLYEGFNTYRISPETNVESLICALTDFQPDVICTAGWFSSLYRRTMQDRSLRKIKKILAIDTQRKPGISQSLRRLRYGHYINHFDKILVPGERSYQFAKYLGFEEHQIQPGLYCIDQKLFSPAFEKRDWTNPRFLFVGRYIDAKSIGVLVDAYVQYRSAVDNPWEMTTCGKGPLEHLLQHQTGIQDLGFVQPSDLPSVMAKHHVLLLPSRYEPWGQVIGETGTTGMPVICTVACGASVELVQNLYNGIVLPSADCQLLCQAMIWMHNNLGILPEMGTRGRQLAGPYNASLWATRVQAMCQDLLS